jgi:hypothetical protein
MTKEDLQSVVNDLVALASEPRCRPGLLIPISKLNALLQAWEPPDSEIETLRTWVAKATYVLGCPYEIRPATFKNPSGETVMLRILDEAAVLKLLKRAPLTWMIR